MSQMERPVTQQQVAYATVVAEDADDECTRLSRRIYALEDRLARLSGRLAKLEELLIQDGLIAEFRP
jgi:hypothetical protein